MSCQWAAASFIKPRTEQILLHLQNQITAFLRIFPHFSSDLEKKYVETTKNSYKVFYVRQNVSNECHKLLGGSNSGV